MRFPWPAVRRALILALIVGTLLNLINSGDAFLQGKLPANAWKIPLTYFVPFAVSLYSSMAQQRRG